MNPITEVTLENGKTSLFAYRFKYENINEDKEIKFQLQFEIISNVCHVG